VSDRVELVVMVGLQGAGKSTLVRSRYALTHHLVSKDLWPNARRREARQQRVVDELLGAGTSVVLDNTNPSVEERAPLVCLARRHSCAVVAVYVDTPIDIAAARNAAREGAARVPDVGFYATVKRLVPPTEAEGFDCVEIVRCPDADVRPGT
jgi:predicted kinase